MKSVQISHHINRVKKDNVKWLRYANALINGVHLGKDAIPNVLGECTSCQWLSDHSEELVYINARSPQDEVDLFHFDLVEQVYMLRYALLEHYLDIFKIYLPEFNHSFFSTLFHSKSTHSVAQKVKAKETYREMQKLVSELNQKLLLLENSLLHPCQLNIA